LSGFFQLSLAFMKYFSIDATFESGRLGRLVNHSKVSSNCRTKVVMLDGIPRLVFIAKKDILPGSELYYDYGDRFVSVYFFLLPYIYFRNKINLLGNPWLAK
jgi:hypothetical protein